MNKKKLNNLIVVKLYAKILLLKGKKRKYTNNIMMCKKRQVIRNSRDVKQSSATAEAKNLSFLWQKRHTHGSIMTSQPCCLVSAARLVCHLMTNLILNLILPCFLCTCRLQACIWVRSFQNFVPEER